MRNSSLVTLAPLLLLAGTALAQERSDLMPPPPAAPEGRQAIMYPGQPMPASDSPPPPVTGGADKAPARRGYDMYEPSTFFGSSSSQSRVESDRVPETHVVRKGDTLWDIAGYYFRNNWYWPKLWSFNPSVTNPHWIYPGDIVRLMAPGEQPQASPVSTPNAPDRLRAPVRSTGVFLRQTGFIEPDELKHAGTIVGSKEERMMLGEHDEAYVDIDKDRPLRVGERYTVYRPLAEVKHPVTKKKIGMLVQILGEAEVKTFTNGHIARCLIIDATEPIERGFKVGPLRRQFKIVEPVSNSRDLAGVVVVAMQPIKMLATDNLVFIDLGKNDGVVIGNRFSITRRGDGVQPQLATTPVDDRRYPREVVGEVLVIDVRDSISTAFMTKSIRELHIGDRVEARKGY